MLDIFHLYIVRSHHVRTVAADGFFHGLYDVFVDPLMDSGQDLVVGDIVFLCHKAAEVLHGECFHLVIGERLNSVHESIFDFLRAVCGNAAIGDLCQTFYSEFFGFGDPIVPIPPAAFLFAQCIYLGLGITVGEPERYINTGHFFQLLFRGEASGEKPTLFAPAVEFFHSCFPCDRKGQHISRLVFSRQPSGEYHRSVAVVAECGGSFRFCNDLCPAVLTGVEPCFVLERLVISFAFPPKRLLADLPVVPCSDTAAAFLLRCRCCRRIRS